MSRSVENFILVQTIEPVETGQEFRRIPLHMTILPWFAIARSQVSELYPVLDALIAEYGAASKTATGLERVQFGPNEDIPACKMSVNSTEIHDATLSAIDTLEGSFNYDSFARNWAPHMTDEEGQSIQPNAVVSFSSLAMFSRNDSENVKSKKVEYSSKLED